MYTLYLIINLPSSVIGAKTPVEAWSGRVSHDYDSLRVFDCLAYYHVKKDKLDLRVRQCVFIRFKKDVRDYKIWDPKNKKFILSRDAMFDETSMMKPTNSQQVDSR